MRKSVAFTHLREGTRIMRRLRIAIGLTLSIVVASVIDAQAVTVVPVKNTKLYEVQPESTTFNGHHLFAWTRTATPNAVGRGWNVIVSLGGPGRQISRKGSYAWPGGFDEMGRLIFQQAFATSPLDSDLFMWSDGRVTNASTVVNNPAWQYGGDRWGDWLVYGESLFRRSRYSIMAFNFSTSRKRTLVSMRCSCVSPGNVVGNLTAYRFGPRIVVGQLGFPFTVIDSTHHATGFSDHDPFLVDPTPDQSNSGDETLFWVRAKRGACGQPEQILEAPLEDLSAFTVVASFRTGKVNSLSVDDSTGSVDVYFGHQTCARTPRSDIFEIPNV